MEKFIIEGGNKLSGSVKLSGSKNAALPIISATIAGDGISVIHNVPDVRDIRTLIKILEYIGARTVFDNNTLEVDPSGICRFTAPYEFVSTMRGSVCLLGPLLAKHGQARFSMPGGCVIGSRPIDLHIKGLSRLGIDISHDEDGYITGKARNLTGNSIFLGGHFGSSVLATANIMIAAALAEGETLVEFASCEPEIVDLAHMLKKMGARIHGEGSHLIRIEGVKRLSGAEHTVIPDRIEAGTYILAGYVTGSAIDIEGINVSHVFSLLDKLEEAGARFSIEKDVFSTIASESYRAVDVITLPYPGFPTDLQAQMMTFLTLAEGISLVTEKVFPERFIHVGELNRLGASIKLNGATAIIKGVKRLKGAKTMASDLRASAAIVLGGLAAEGCTDVARIYHLDRGYERFEEKLQKLGASIRRVRE